MIEDLVAYPGRTSVEEELIQSGVRTFICAPLHYQDRVIGTMELVSDRVGDLNATHLPKLQEVLPLFSMAVQRSVEELNSRIQTVINEQCTAIHPTVEWRFRKAVLNAFERQRGSASVVTELEPIVFEGVYPLFGLADIRGSSTQRGRAIQTDLLQQLRLARAVIQSASATRPGPALDELAFRIDSRAAQIERGLNSSDEIGVITFLRTQVEGLLDHLETFGRRRPGADRRLPGRPRPSARHRVPPAPDVRGERHRHRGEHLVVPGAGATGGAGDVPALLREAKDRRSRLSDLRRGGAPGERSRRPPVPEEPASVAAHDHVRDGGPRSSAARSPPDPARDDAPDPGAARAAVDPVPIRREALRRRRGLRHPVRDHEEANRQGAHRGDDRARDPAREGGPHLQPARRGPGVPGLHRVPGESRLPDRLASSSSTWRSCRGSRASARSGSRSPWTARSFRNESTKEPTNGHCGSQRAEEEERRRGGESLEAAPGDGAATWTSRTRRESGPPGKSSAISWGIPGRRRWPY